MQSLSKYTQNFFSFIKAVLTIGVLLTLSGVAWAIGVDGIDMWLGHINPGEEKTIIMRMSPGKTQFRAYGDEAEKISCIWRDGESKNIIKEESDVRSCNLIGENNTRRWTVLLTISNKKNSNILFYRVAALDLKK